MLEAPDRVTPARLTWPRRAHVVTGEFWMLARRRPAAGRALAGWVVAALLVMAGTAHAETLWLDPPRDAGGKNAGRKDSAAAERDKSEPEVLTADDLAYARMCDAFGEGFTYSPGTGACIKIGGYVKFGTSFGTTRGSATR